MWISRREYLQLVRATPPQLQEVAAEIKLLRAEVRSLRNVVQRDQDNAPEYQNGLAPDGGPIVAR